MINNYRIGLISFYDFSKQLFLNINEHSKAASICDSLGADYWSTLAKKSGDRNWLSRSKIN